MNKYWITAVSILLLAAFIPASAQSGGGFEITEGVVGGGGDQAANNDISVDSTVGQAVSLGCIRMKRKDVETLFEWVSRRTQVDVRR